MGRSRRTSCGWREGRSRDGRRCVIDSVKGKGAWETAIMSRGNRKEPAVPRVQGLYETHLTVSTLERSVPFYRDVVGLELATVFADRVAFFCGSGRETAMLGLWQSGGAP